MAHQRFWEYDEHDRIYIHHFGRCVAHVWQEANALWNVKIESGRREARRYGFMSYAEAQAWVDQYVADTSAAERRITLRAS